MTVYVVTEGNGQDGFSVAGVHSTLEGAMAGRPERWTEIGSAGRWVCGSLVIERWTVAA